VKRALSRAALAQRAGDRARGQVGAREQLADLIREARAPEPLLQRLVADDHEVVAVAVAVEAAAAEHVAAIEEHCVVGAGERRLAALDGDPHGRRRKDDVRDLADEVLQRPAHVVGRAPERAERDHRAHVERVDAHPIPLTGMPRGEAQRSWRGFGQGGHRRDRKRAPAATGNGARTGE
jgi:hypothetical protein